VTQATGEPKIAIIATWLEFQPPRRHPCKFDDTSFATYPPRFLFGRQLTERYSIVLPATMAMQWGLRVGMGLDCDFCLVPSVEVGK